MKPWSSGSDTEQMRMSGLMCSRTSSGMPEKFVGMYSMVPWACSLRVSPPRKRSADSSLPGYSPRWYAREPAPSIWMT